MGNSDFSLRRSLVSLWVRLGMDRDLCVCNRDGRMNQIDDHVTVPIGEAGRPHTYSDIIIY